MSLELGKLSGFTGRPGPLLLIIMDGVGIGKQDDSDGVFLAKTPCLDELMKSKLYTQLMAHGTAVGMPSDADMGNSEVGHNALGAGRVYDQGAKLVQNAVDSGALFTSEAWKKCTERVRQSGQALHFLGLFSDGNVHSHIEHLKAMVKKADAEGIAKVRVHVLLDGRDVHETSALDYVDDFEKLLSQLREKGRDYYIASGGGRMKVTMDRYEAE